MKKLFFKILSTSLSVTLALTVFSIKDTNQASATACVSKNGNEFHKKVVEAVGIGVGVGGAVTIGAVAVGLICVLTKNKNTNANFTNTQNLCFWHSLVQQLYSLNSFRKFIENADLKSEPETAKKNEAFAKLFNLMARCDRIDMSKSEEFAKQILPKEKIGTQQDINEAWTSFISDIKDKYTQYYGGQTNIIAEFVERKTSLNLILGAQNFDVPVIEDQFAIFVNSVDLSGKKYTSIVDFGDGTVKYKNQDFEVTAISVHVGNDNLGHYYTYKKQGDKWYTYDDTCSTVNQVSWEQVKEVAEKNCTMITFSKKQN